MSDGSNMGITAGRALGTILGGDEQPTEDEKATKEETRARIMSRPDPSVDERAWDMAEGEDGYSFATDCIAKAFILIEEKYPGTLETKLYYPDDFEYEPLRGMERSPEMAVWEKAAEEWPSFKKWAGGASGFMVGFAYNVARWLTEKPIVQNPAIITVNVPDAKE